MTLIQDVQLFFRFYAFRYQLDIHFQADVAHRLDECPRFFVDGDVLNQAAIQLENVEVCPGKQREIGEFNAEIVDRHTESKAPHSINDPAQIFFANIQRVFSDFNFQQIRSI